MQIYARNHQSMQKARSRRHISRRLRRLKVETFILIVLMATYLGVKLVSNLFIFHPVQALADNDNEVVYVEKPVPVEVEVDRTFVTEKQQIMAYLIEKFGDRADDAITMINTCENSTFNPSLINKGNNNRTWDVGVMQINVQPTDTQEVEKLKYYKYNIDRGYEKYKAHKNTFYLWSCGDKAGDYTYKMKLEGK